MPKRIPSESLPELREEMPFTGIRERMILPPAPEIFPTVVSRSATPSVQMHPVYTCPSTGAVRLNTIPLLIPGPSLARSRRANNGFHPPSGPRGRPDPGSPSQRHSGKTSQPETDVRKGVSGEKSAMDILKEHSTGEITREQFKQIRDHQKK